MKLCMELSVPNLSSSFWSPKLAHQEFVPSFVMGRYEWAFRSTLWCDIQSFNLTFISTPLFWCLFQHMIISSTSYNYYDDKWWPVQKCKGMHTKILQKLCSKHMNVLFRCNTTCNFFLVFIGVTKWDCKSLFYTSLLHARNFFSMKVTTVQILCMYYMYVRIYILDSVHAQRRSQMIDKLYMIDTVYYVSLRLVMWLNSLASILNLITIQIPPVEERCLWL